MNVWKLEEILKYMSKIKKNGKCIGNYYNIYNINDNIEFVVLLGDNTIVFYCDDNIEVANIVIKRAYFLSNDKKELVRLLAELPENTVLDVITRDINELVDVMQFSGMDTYATFERISKNYKTYDREKYANRRKAMDSIYDEKYGYWATEDDLEDILKKMIDVFDPYTYHLCSREELRTYIKNKWCMIHRNENKEIISITIFKIEGCKRYGYYMYNEGSIDMLYSVQKKVSSLDKEKGITYFYGWQDVKNRKAKKVNDFYGNKSDGLYDIVYIKKNEK